MYSLTDEGSYLYAMPPADLFQALTTTTPHHRRALGRAITLVESSRPEDLAPAAELIALAERYTPPRPHLSPRHQRHPRGG